MEDADRLLADMEAVLSEQRVGSVQIDLADVSYIDSAGVLTLFRLEDQLRQKGSDYVYSHVPSRIRGIMALISRDGLEKPPLRPERTHEGIIETVGDAGFKIGRASCRERV